MPAATLRKAFCVAFDGATMLHTHALNEHCLPDTADIPGMLLMGVIS